VSGRTAIKRVGFLDGRGGIDELWGRREKRRLGNHENAVAGLGENKVQKAIGT